MPRIHSFETYSDVYDDWFKKNADLFEAELEAIRQVIPPPGLEGMEVGVGSGKFAAPLGIKIGVEPSEKMAIKARMQGIKVCSGVAENLPFSSGRFDFVLIVTTICFVDDIIKSFNEAFRVLKPKGCVVVGFVDKESKLGRQYADKRDKSKFYKDAMFVSAQDVLNFLEETGFISTKIKQTLIPGEPVEAILDGFGKGAFVAIKGAKRNR